MSPSRGPCADFQLGLWKSTNCVGNINTAKSLQKSWKQFASRRNRSPRLGSCSQYLLIILSLPHIFWIFFFQGWWEMYSELLIFLPIFFPFHIFFILFSRGSYIDYTPLYLSYLFMTGLDAGLVYNSFPKFADRNNVK